MVGIYRALCQSEGAALRLLLLPDRCCTRALVSYGDSPASLFPFSCLGGGRSSTRREQHVGRILGVAKGNDCGWVEEDDGDPLLRSSGWRCLNAGKG